ELLAGHVRNGEEMPEGYRFPPMATLIEEYLRRGHRVSVFTLDPTTERLRTFEGDQLTIHVGRYRPRARYRATDFFAAERADLVEALRADPCDIVHAHWTYEFALAAIASGTPYLVTAHDAPLHILRLYRNAYRFLRTLMAVRVSRRARFMTAVSPYVARHFEKLLGHRGTVTVVPNGLSEELFALGEGREQRSGGEPPVFATVLTGWGRLKNGSAALEAFGKVRATLPGARLLMFGYGHGAGEEAEAWARQRGLEGGVEFVGTLPHPELMRRLSLEADVLVHPALEEAHPVGVSEAMALGLPVIGGERSGGVPFTLDHGEAGVLVDVRSAEDLSRCMLRLAGDAAARVELGAAARESARRRFHVERVVDAYEETFGKVLAAFGAGR
nr:glycosyltransferase family 4 protein [Rubrobacter sp.]